jgi:hypothetical protein
MTDPCISEQLPALVGPLQRIVASGVRKKGFHPVAISHAMMLAGMLELLDAAGKEFTLEILRDLVTAVEEAESGKTALQ